MKMIENALHKEVPINVFEIFDVPDLPQGYYCTIAVFFDELDTGDGGIFQPHLHGVFKTPEEAKARAIRMIDNIEATLDEEESNWAFTEE